MTRANAKDRGGPAGRSAAPGEDHGVVGEGRGVRHEGRGAVGGGRGVSREGRGAVGEGRGVSREGRGAVGEDPGVADGAGGGPDPAPDLRLAVPAAAGWLVLLLGLPHPAVLGWLAVGCFVTLLIGAAVVARSRRTIRARRPIASLPAMIRPGRVRSGVAATGLLSVTVAVTVAATLLIVGLHATAGWARHAVAAAGPVRALAEQRAVVTVEGLVATDPRVFQENAERPRTQVLITVLVEGVTGRGRVADVQTPVLVRASTDTAAWAALRWRERVRVAGRLSAAPADTDVVAFVTARGPPVSLDRAPPAFRGAERVRQGLRDATAGLPPNASGLVPALVIGDRSVTPHELNDDMRATGMSHLSAVSGTNVTIVLTLALRLAAVARVPRRGRPVLAFVVLIGFVVLARPDPSVLRAAVMGAVGVLGVAAARPGAGLPALSGAVVVLLTVDPWLARSYGFALSTLATFGLLVFVRPWAAWLRSRLPERFGWLAEPIVIPVAAQVVTAPVVVLLQGSISAVGVLANLVASPLVAPATIGGVLVAILGTATGLPGLGPAVRSLTAVLAWAPGLPALGIAQVAHRAAVLPWGIWPWPDGVPGALLLAGLTAGLLCAWPWLVGWCRRHPLPLLVVVVLLVATWWPVTPRHWPPPGWRLAACDVGQGDALVVATGPGSAVLVDTGPEPDLVDSCLARLQVRHLDAIVLTHPHEDHVDGLAGAVGGRSVAAVLVSPLVVRAGGGPTPVGGPTAAEDPTAGVALEAGAPVSPVYAGDVLRWGEVEATVRWPARRIESGSVPNNASVVLDVSAPGLRALLMADVEREAGAAIRSALRREAGRASPPVDVVKIAHHGSANQDRQLLADVGAPLALISVGADNSYGHPAPSLLELLARTGTTVLRTDRRGDIAVVAVDDRIKVATLR